MGVDTRIKIEGLKLPPSELRRAGYELASAIGAGNFHITKEEHCISVNGEVHFWSRYYGLGYERGNWPIIRAVLEWCRRKFPDATVFYGSDHSDDFDEVTDELLATINNHFLDNGHRPYSSGFNFGESTPTCEKCQEPMINYGGGGGKIFYRCAGCDSKLEVTKT